MKKILSVALGEMSTGEISIAQAFEEELDRTKYVTNYLLPASKKLIMDEERQKRTVYIDNEESAGTNRQQIIRVINDEKPDLIILFDVFTFEYSQSWTGINLEQLKELGVPVVTLDEYEYTKAGYKLDYYGIFVKRLPALVERCDYIIKNCPLSMPESKEEPVKNSYYYQVFNKEKFKSRVSQLEFYDLENVRRDGYKTVMFTLSDWETQGAYSFSNQNQLMKWLGPIIFYYMKEMNDNVILVQVGSAPLEIESDEHMIYRHYKGLPVDQFEALLQNSDLFITYNKVSFTLSKAVMLGIPSVVLNNSKIIDFMQLEHKLKEKPRWYQNMASEVQKVYPFTASMFGWSHFLKSVLMGNLYDSTYKTLEVFNTQKTLEGIKYMLGMEKNNKSNSDLHKAFYSKYDEIMSADMVMDGIMSDIRKKRG